MKVNFSSSQKSFGCSSYFALTLELILLATINGNLTSRRIIHTNSAFYANLDFYKPLNYSIFYLIIGITHIVNLRLHFYIYNKKLIFILFRQKNYYLTIYLVFFII